MSYFRSTFRSLQNRCSEKFRNIFRSVTILKKTPTQMFSCEDCETFKNRFFYRTSLVAVSELCRQVDKNH